MRGKRDIYKHYVRAIPNSDQFESSGSSGLKLTELHRELNVFTAVLRPRTELKPAVVPGTAGVDRIQLPGFPKPNITQLPQG